MERPTEAIEKLRALTNSDAGPPFFPRTCDKALAWIEHLEGEVEKYRAEPGPGHYPGVLETLSNLMDPPKPTTPLTPCIGQPINRPTPNGGDEVDAG